MLAVKSSFLLCNLFHAQAFYAFLKNVFLVHFISVEFLIDKVLDTYYSACCLRTSITIFFIKMNLLICFEVYKHITCIQLHSCL